MQTDKLFKTAGILGIAYLVINAISNAIYSRIQFGTTGIKLGTVTAQGVNVEITQPITNTNPVSFPVEQLEFNVLYGDNVLSRVVMPQEVSIEANETTLLEFDAFLNFGDLGGSVMDLINSGEYLQALRVKGFAKSSDIVIPFTNTISVG